MSENILDKLARDIFGEKPDETETEIIETEYKTATREYDLTKPPGFVGEICDYINSQCRYTRAHLASISAIVAVGNMGSMKYENAMSQTSSNLFAFCVAGSTTGKEAILQAVSDLHIEANISHALHGKIKSDRELVINLTRNQASFYAIDEIGIELKKIMNSSRSGGATYLQSVIGTLMSLYSKSCGNYLLSGDMKIDVIESLKKEYAKEDSSNSADEYYLNYLSDKINNIEKYGLKNPFLSLIGFTTPATFNDIVSIEQITSGFIGRSLIVNEPDTNPRRKRGFVKPRMSDDLRNKILYFVATGNSDTRRIEESEEKVKIETDNDAMQELENAADWFEDEAEKHTERTGFESVVRRGYEMIDKISFILAMQSRHRTLEHVKWSVEYVQRDIEYKTLLAYSNDREKTSPIESMAAKIMAIISDGGMTIGKICNRYRANKKLVEDAIKYLETKKKITIQTKKAKFQNRDTKYIYKA